MDNKPPIPKRMMQARLKAGLSQKRLGVAAGIDPFSASARINQYERGKHTPDYGTAARLARVLGVPTPFLYAKEDDIAKMILLFGSLGVGERRKWLARLRDAAGADSQ